MELFLLWIIPAHIIYMCFAVYFTNTETSDDMFSESLSEYYIYSLFWPLFLVFGGLYLAMICTIQLLVYVNYALNWVWEYIGDMYWDIAYFVAYIKTVTRKP
jgi:hypothetical protein